MANDNSPTVEDGAYEGMAKNDFLYNALYSSSVTGSHHSFEVSVPAGSNVRCENQLSFLAPCQCFTKIFPCKCHKDNTRENTYRFTI